ncbi:MAG: sporulation initiation factor Spo0A C-terminal domain-containing protein [Anaerovoracaceae bacterium]|nr:sporulation initiation factor Spo0A C-terminal domain-containing protein [Anaerovoracaceae bacterium]
MTDTKSTLKMVSCLCTDACHDSFSKKYAEACRILSSLGITANYAGFHYSAFAIALAAAEPQRLQLVTKWLYPDVAAKYRTSSDSVRKCICRTCHIAWENNRTLLEEMALRPLKEKPGTSEFLAIITVHLVL